MQALLENPTDEAQEVDLSALIAQQKVNSYWHYRKLPHRYLFQWKTNDVLEVSIRGHAVAVYVKSIKALYRVEGSLEMPWRMVERVFRDMAVASEGQEEANGCICRPRPRLYSLAKNLTLTFCVYEQWHLYNA